MSSRNLLFKGHHAGSIEALLSRLAEGVPADSAVSTLHRSSGLPDANVQAALSALARRGALIRRRPSDDYLLHDGSGLYDRQIRFFGYYESNSTSAEALNLRLQQRHVLVTGLGGLGGWIALMLARLGVRTLTGVDPDRVELSNLHRQILYEREDLGKSKAVAARERLTAADGQLVYQPICKWINEPEDLLPYLNNVDLVINPFPLLPSFRSAALAVATAALRARIACLNLPSAMTVGPLTVRGDTPCLRCADETPSLQISSGSPLSSIGRPFLAALPPRQAISAGIGVWEATRFLSGLDGSSLVGRLIRLDIDHYVDHRSVEVGRRSDCLTVHSCWPPEPTVESS